MFYNCSMKKTLFGIIICLYSINLSAQDNKAIMEINYETKIISDSLNRDKVNIYSTALVFNNTQSIYRG